MVNKGTCCQWNSSNGSFCVCEDGYEGAWCHRKTRVVHRERSDDGVTNSSCTSTTEQRNTRAYMLKTTTTTEGQMSTPRESSEQPPATSIGLMTTPTSVETTTKDDMSAPTESRREQPPGTTISLTTFVVVIAVGVLLCIASDVITRFIFKRKDDSVEIGIKDGNTNAEKKHQNLKTTRLNEDGDMQVANHYDTLELYDKGYETIDEYSLGDPNYTAIQYNEYLDVIAEADDENIEEADDNDCATTEDHQSEQTEANVTYQSLPVQETPSIERSS